MPVPEVNIEDFSYILPPGQIAQYPLPERDSSRLICSIGGAIREDSFRNIAGYIPSDSMMVFNNTRVIRARLIFQKASGTPVEIFCLEPAEPTKEINQAFQQQGPVVWNCLIGNARHWKSGILGKRITVGGTDVTLQVERKNEPEQGIFSVRLSWAPSGITFGELLNGVGRTPLPPYISREDDQADVLRYQTIYALHDGSVAAPTAGFHFTKTVMDSLAAKNTLMEQVTLHVGLGTFKPVTVMDLSQHVMHQEQIRVEADVIRRLLNHLPNPVVAVGTTSVRTLESLYWLGLRQFKNPEVDQTDIGQWDPYTFSGEPLIPVEDVLNALIRRMERRKLSTLSATTRLMIVPGYQFRVITGMVTNFHQPRSTLLMLIAAYLGERWKEVYHYGLTHEFRFLSYGDGCLFLP